MKRNIFIYLFFTLCLASRGQTYVTIPDANFVSWLQANYPSAMSGNQLNTSNTSVTADTIVIVNAKGIYDLTGIQYFTSLRHLECSQNYLTSLPSLPSTLKYLSCSQNQLNSLPAIPSNLQILYCDNNLLPSLPTLPNSIISLGCSNNPNLTALPALPTSLDSLFCSGDSLSSLPSLPSQLKWLGCDHNIITNLPTLPNTIEGISCGYNSLTSIPVLPSTLTQFNCSGNPLTSLPSLPTGLIYFGCDSVGASILPTLPSTLQVLSCVKNNLTNLPPLPASLQSLICARNQLSTLPTLPNLFDLDCSQNQITCLPVLPTTINGIFDFSGNLFNCLPNYIPYMSPQVLNIPLCSAGNTNGCAAAGGILGVSYRDMNSDCINNAGDNTIKNLPFKLYDISNNLVGNTISAKNGVYNFAKPNGTYKVVVDTSYLPLKIQCAFPGIDSTVLVSGLDSNVNFSFTCKPGFDLGVQSVSTAGFVFPGQTHTLTVNAGGFSNWYGLNCASGVAGQLQLTIVGNVSYISPASSALTPTVSGNTFTYQIPDFGLVNNLSDFSLVLKTDTSAQSGDSICISVKVTPNIGDNDSLNNNYQICYLVRNSLDPNLKEVYPVGVPVGFSDWLTYTIHFQNTGNAPAMNIRLLDSLDNNLDLSTFQVIGYSGVCNPYLNRNILTVYYPNIMLSDSASNPSGSIGYFQYRIKPKSSWHSPTQIKNRANIFFDFNTPIATNTTVNYFLTSVGIEENRSQNDIQVYPNPSEGYVIIENNEKIEEISIFDLTGRLILKRHPHLNKDFIELNVPGCYFITLKSDGKSSTKKVIVR